jgi:hypothetical protein
MKLDTTFVLARVIGPVLLFAGVLLITQPARMLSAMTGFISSDALLVLAGFITLIIGLGLVALHQRWDGFTAGFLSVLGWAVTLRGAMLLLAPELVRRAAGFVLTHANALPIAGLVLALIGVWLTYAGYIAGTLRVETARK